MIESLAVHPENLSYRPVSESDPELQQPASGFIECRQTELPPHSDSGVLLMMSLVLHRITTGSATCHGPKGKMNLKPGDIVIIAPGQSHRFLSGPETVRAQSLHIAPYSFGRELYGDSDIHRLLDTLHGQAFAGDHLLSVSQSNTPVVAESFDALARESQKAYAGRNAVIKSHCYRFLASLLSEPKLTEQLQAEVPYASSLGRMASVLAHIQEHYRERITVANMSDMAQLSRSHFHTAFRQATGCSLIEYVNRFRLMRAKNAVLRTDRPMADIASEYGFGNASRFSTVHKQLYGTTPMQARQTHRESHRQDSLKPFER